jgi:hypothetical protein
VNDRYQYLRNDGCLATRQMLGVARARGLGWPTPENSEPVPPRATPASYQPSIPSGREEELCRAETINNRIRCAYDAVDPGCSARYLGESVGRACCLERGAVGRLPPLLQDTGCHCSCAVYDELLRGPAPPPPPPLEPCVLVADLPADFLRDRGYDHSAVPRGARLPCENHGRCKQPEPAAQGQHPYCACVDGWGGPTCEDFAPYNPNSGFNPGESPEKACRRYLADACNPIRWDFESMEDCNVCIAAQIATITADMQNPCLQAPQTVQNWCEEVLPPPLPPSPAPEPQPIEPPAPVACKSLGSCKECEAYAAQQGIG